MGVFRAIGAGIKGTVKSCVNVPAWMSIWQLKENTFFLWSWIKLLFKQQHSNYHDNFEQAVSRFQLTEEGLEAKANNCLKHVYIYIVASIICLIYFAYLFFNRHIIAALLTILIFILFLIKAWGSHFWYFQIKQRKLGCSFKEWWSGHIEEVE